MRYSPELKDAILRRLLPPNNESVTKIAKEEGIPAGTLRRWKVEAKSQGVAAPTGDNAEDWSTQDKFLIVVETAKLNETDLAEYAREKGLYVEQIKAWRDACMNANGGVAREAAKLTQDLKEEQKARKKLEKELQRKEKALAETAALLVLSKKANAIWGGSRGRSISATDRETAVELIDEAVDSGARLFKACDVLKITERTYWRWVKLQKEFNSFEDRRAYADHSNPANKISPKERQQILDYCNSERFADMPPCQIVPTLADEGIYIASEATFYRVLKEEKLLNHRGRSQEPGKRHKPTSYSATAPNQVWTWDITYLNGPIKGIFYYLYLIIDLYSRDVVGWEVWNEESAEHASELIKKACLAQNRLSTMPLVLHSDNGAPMKGSTMLATLYALNITPSNSRPRVSNDNPYSESLFKTLKYRPNYQPKGFATLEEARLWCSRFVKWYRNDHRHSGIKFVTAAQRHAGLSKSILQKRHEIYEAAKAAHPERWNGRATRNWDDIEVVYLNPDKVAEETKVNLQATTQQPISA